jgi:hypothetical protein
LVSEQEAFAAIKPNIRSEQSLIPLVEGTAGKVRQLSNMEAKGVYSRQVGIGPMVSQLIAVADTLDQLAANMTEKSAQIDGVSTRAQTLMQNLQRAVGDDETFAKQIVDLNGKLTDLNAFNLTELAQTAESASLDIGLRDANAQRLKQNVAAILKEVTIKAKDVAESRQAIVIPTYVPIEGRQAVLRYASTVAIGGWITACSVDILPLLLLVVVMATSRETLLQKSVH